MNKDKKRTNTMTPKQSEQIDRVATQKRLSQETPPDVKVYGRFRIL